MKNAIEYLIATVAKYPNKIGFEDSTSQISFKDFYTKACYLSTHMLNFTPPPIPKIIAIFLPKNIQSLLSIAGILLSGNVYMPLDIKSPKERLKSILE
ncbi:AMP-binding protein, partial [Helicobacter sp. 13S00477-4]|uniref:AMP-binding protein n=1 Tax=Helicobacter sp. 13S00477-4 TaxID=1905759 RepID=UPI00117A9A71